MSECSTTPRFTLRQLPLPAKLVVTLFMLSVGLGYFSALVQMHFQHTQGDGAPLPGKNDLIEIFAGKKWVTKEEAAAARPMSKMEAMISGPIDKWPTSMAGAFFQKDPTKKYQKLIGDGSDPVKKAQVIADREGERAALKLWLQLPKEQQQAAYESDKFIPPADLAPKAVTEKFLWDKAVSSGVKVKSIIAARCTACHSEGGAQSAFPLDTYAGIVKYSIAPPGITVPEGASGVYTASSRQISKEKLAQSTHAHLLSFAMLFALTGLVFSFTSYCSHLRCLLSPIVLLAQVADVSCWWLARLDTGGIYFAQAILATGAVVGLGLAVQIIGSVFNMYGRAGKFVLLLMFLGAGTAGFVVVNKIAIPQLKEEKARKEEEAKQKEEADKQKPGGEKTETLPNGVDPKATPPTSNGKNGPAAKSHDLERVLTGKWEGAPWGPDKETKIVPNGGMVRAFYDKDGDFKDVYKERAKDAATFMKLQAERQGEQNAILAWIHAKPEDRKKAYEKNEFALPPELKGKPITPELLANDRTVKIKDIFELRCSSCHGEGTKLELDTYPRLEKFMK